MAEWRHGVCPFCLEPGWPPLFQTLISASISFLPLLIYPSEATSLAFKTPSLVFLNYPPFKLSKEEFLATCLPLFISTPRYLTGSLALTTQEGSQASQASGRGCHSCQLKREYPKTFSHMLMWLLAFGGGRPHIKDSPEGMSVKVKNTTPSTWEVSSYWTWSHWSVSGLVLYNRFQTPL